MALFSVIIPTYNREMLLREALGSVFAQTCTDYEVIVVDDGSTDGTTEYARSLGDRIRLLQQPNRGPGAARNRGAAAAQGTYLAFLDSDDLWFPWTLATFADMLSQCSEGQPLFLAGKAVEIALNQSEIAAAVAAPALRYSRFSDYLAAQPEPPWVPTDGVAIQRDAFLHAGGFSEQRANAEDSDLWLRLGTLAGFVEIVAPPLVVYRRHRNSETALQANTLRGITALIEREHHGEYPGGSARHLERTQVILAHVRPMVVACLKAGHWNTAWALYRMTFRWALRARRYRYLLGCWGLSLSIWIRRNVSARQRCPAPPSQA